MKKAFWNAVIEDISSNSEQDPDLTFNITLKSGKEIRNCNQHELDLGANEMEDDGIVILSDDVNFTFYVSISDIEAVGIFDRPNGDHMPVA